MSRGITVATVLSSVLLSAALLVTAACSQSGNATTTTFSDTRMCIRYKVVVGEHLPTNEAAAVQSAIDTVFAEVDTIYNQWNPDSEVSRINHADANAEIAVSDELATFLLEVERGVALSRGLFDPTVEPLVTAWKGALERGMRLSDARIAEACKGIGWHRLSRGEGTVTKGVAQLQLNFDGVAKGYAVDRIVDEVSALGITSLYVEWGGEIRVTGDHPDQRPWRVMVTGIDGVAGAEHLEVVDLIDEAIATSGDYYQQWCVTAKDGSGDEDAIYTHIVNPVTGQALQVQAGGVASATVIAPTCALADALATTCMLFESGEEARQWAVEVQERMEGIRIWIVTREEKSSGERQ